MPVLLLVLLRRLPVVFLSLASMKLEVAGATRRCMMLDVLFRLDVILEDAISKQSTVYRCRV